MKGWGCGDRVIAALFVLAAVLLFTSLDNGYLWQDEAETALLGRHVRLFGYPKGADGIRTIEIEPFGLGPHQAWIYSPWLQFYIVAGSFALFGESTWTARAPFALFGLLTLYLTWKLACRLTSDWRIQQLSVALLACSVPFLLHARQCRYYSLAMALGVGICLVYLAFLERPTGKRAAGVAGLMALLFHTNFGTFIPVAVALAAHQAVWGKPEASRLFLLAMGAVVLVTYPWALWTYRPAFFGTWSLARAYAHLQYYVRVTNKYLLPLGFIAVSTGLFWWSKMLPPDGFWGSPRPRVRSFFILLVVTQLLFLVVPDQRHLRYWMPAAPLLTIGLAWWLVRFWLQPRLRLLGWVVISLVMFTTVLHSLRPTVPLTDLAEELTHRYVGPMEGVVDYLNAHGHPGEAVKIPYDDRTVMFYTAMQVEPPSQFLRETYPEWIVPRGGWAPKRFFSSAYFQWIQATYDRIELDAPDAFWQNREDPGLHHFRRAWWPSPVVIYRKRVAS